MIIILSPIVKDKNKIWYEITENKITATINDVTDTFDFTGIPNGKLQLHGSDGESVIETTLDEVPILGADNKDGVFTVEILFSIDIKEKDERLLFPEPMSLVEFDDLMTELKKRDEVEDSSDEPEDDRYEAENIDIEEVDF